MILGGHGEAGNFSAIHVYTISWTFREDVSIQDANMIFYTVALTSAFNFMERASEWKSTTEAFDPSR